MKETDAREVLRGIHFGQYDANLDALDTEIKERRRVIANANLLTFKPGDKVRFTNRVRPHDLAGQVATVKRIRRGRVIVTLDTPTDRVFGEVSVPPILVEAIR